VLGEEDGVRGGHGHHQEEVRVARLDLGHHRLEVEAVDGIGLVVDDRHVLRLEEGHGRVRDGLAEDRVVVDDGCGLRHGARHFRDELVERLRVDGPRGVVPEHPLESFRGDDVGRGVVDDVRCLEPLGHGGDLDGLARGAAPREDEHLGLGDELLGHGGRQRVLGLVVVDDDLDLLAVDAALGVDLLDGHPVCLLELVAKGRVGASHGLGRADLERVLRPGGRRRGGDEKHR
jgi:hypothetical protein